MSEKNLTGKELGAMAARIEDDGPGTPYECQACEKPYDPAAKCEESLHDGDSCEEPDPDDVCRDDRARLLEEVDRLRVSLSAALRSADRLRHGQDIEGDNVCPNEMRAEKSERLAGAERELRKAEEERRVPSWTPEGQASTTRIEVARAALIEAGGKP